MIAHIKGLITEKHPTHVVIDCNGVGYHLNISLNTYSKISDKESCKLLTQLIVREDAHILYGFYEAEERELFRHLISVSGIGSSTAMMMLSSLSADEIKSAIVNENVSLIKSIKGIGPKTAQRVILDLKDKFGKVSLKTAENILSHNTVKEEALTALVALGFQKNIAEKAINKAFQDVDGKARVEELIKLALKNL
jgi:Holliday junction DNA helicase RuvA